MSRLPSVRQLWTGLGLALLLLLTLAGWVLVSDQSGLRAEYFALGKPWEGRPFNSKVGEPGLGGASDVSDALLTKVVFSIRWRGWWAVGHAGEHRFSLDANDGGYLRIDDELIVDTQGLFGEPLASGSKALEPGFHAVEIGLHQSYGESRLTVHWAAPGSNHESTAPLPLADLYSGRPLVLRQALRRALAGWPRTYRQLLGVVLLLAAALLLRGLAARFGSSAARLRARVQALDGRGLRAALLIALFAFAFFASLPFTGTLWGGDDTSYLQAATFSEKSWFINRYAHVYLLKLFGNLSGSPLAGVRAWWSFAFATTVAALAVAVSTLGPGLQLRTLTATLFILLAQTTLFGLIGAGFADFSTMMFVTVAVATYLHWLARQRELPPPRHEWHALAIGALTVAAMRSKEVGAVLLLLPLLFPLGGGLDLRRLARKIAYWLAGAAAVLSTLVLLDGWLLGEFLFTFDSGRVESSKAMNFPAGVAPRKASVSWLQTIWNPHAHEANNALRNLWLGVCAAALVAGFRRRRLELRLLHLLPIAYLLALIVLYVRMPHPISARMLIPILPVASLMAGLLLYHAGLEEVSWDQILKPVVLVPAALAAAFVFLAVIPYRLGTLEPASLLPAALLRRYGWEPDHFVLGVLLPGIVLIVLSGVALFASRRRAWVAALLVAYVALFGVGFEITRASLTKKWAAQTGALLTYPWKTFRDELDSSAAQTIALSRDLRGYYRMSGVTRSAIAAVTLGRRDLSVFTSERAPENVDAAIASRYAYDAWLQQVPELAATASFDPAGFLVLVRPKQAAELAARRPDRQTAEGPASERGSKSLVERLGELRTNRDPEARGALLQEILDSVEGPTRLSRSIGLEHLLDDRLKAVSLWPDGWTDGTTPAGVIVTNRENKPLAQELRLTIHAAESLYPIRVFVDDGEQVETLRFDRGRTRKIRLQPVPPGSSRLVIIWSDKAWPAKNKNDDRQLGVRIRGVP